MGDEAFFGIKLTKVQRAICRAIDGYPIELLWQRDPDVRNAFLNRQPIPGERPREILFAAGIRGGKSMIAAAMGLDRAITCDLSGFSEKEQEPIMPILSVKKKNAKAVFGHLVKLLTKTAYGEFLVGKPVDESVTVRNQYGIDVQIQVVAGGRAAASLASYWLTGAIFDECFKMTGRDESVVNLEDALVEVRERVIDDCQIMYLGSKWRADGPAWRMYHSFQEDAATAQRVVINATGPMLNPKLWNEKRVERLANSQDSNDRLVYQTSVLGQFIEGEEDLLSPHDIEACTRDAPQEYKPQPGVIYKAAMDPATRRNAWTLVIGCQFETGKLTVAVARQWVPTGKMRLVPEDVVADIAHLLAIYNIGVITTDQWCADFVQTLFRQHGVRIIESTPKGVDAFQELDAIRLAVQSRLIDLPPVPDVAKDLKRLVKRATAAGVRIFLPKTSDGRHCDFAPPLGCLVANPPPLLKEKLRETISEEERFIARLARVENGEWMDGLSESMSR